uniref:hypothetical protein n=1 Tax=Amycolatopsis sp. CA-096443 TaxID=3239919 RepID=UPI003F492E6E
MLSIAGRLPRDKAEDKAEDKANTGAIAEKAGGDNPAESASQHRLLVPRPVRLLSCCAHAQRMRSPQWTFTAVLKSNSTHGTGSATSSGAGFVPSPAGNRQTGWSTCSPLPETCLPHTAMPGRALLVSLVGFAGCALHVAAGETGQPLEASADLLALLPDEDNTDE